MPIVNIHTHQIDDSEIGIQVLNVDNFRLFNFLENQTVFSLGIHPMNINNETIKEDLAFVFSKSENKNCLMIGECGLDRNIKVDFDQQKKILIEQIALAEKVRKPIILHCVRAFDELIQIKRKMNTTVPMIIHGFNNNINIAQKMIQNGFYISLGAQLLNPMSNPSKIITTIPLNRLFLETDNKNQTISSIFAVASSILKIKQSLLEEVIRENYEKIFYATNSL